MSVKNEFLEDIREQRQASSKRKRFSGTFLDYIEHIQDNPHVVMSAHKRLYGRIVERGSQSMPNSDPRKKKIFNSESLRPRMPIPPHVHAFLQVFCILSLVACR